MFITENQFIFINIEDKFDEDNNVWFPMLGLVYELRDMIFKELANRNEKKIDQVFQNNQQELLQKRRNFQLNIVDIKHVEFSEKSTFHSALPDNGRLVFILNNNKQYKFIVPSSVARESVKNLLRESGVPLEIQEKGLLY
ncbi:hypothetical protein QOZ98_002440 [Planomicrobium stackebrandtii]|uniref:Uncharacterized protein n=1 Tax=Planomicrobium stackebrandtii TaxID=253160 RepID=A0ABU0GW94_9BACL|nr:hypothetical protein [Planomicrobium stackebrandtii]MDQ0429612.1 hypothetical protein [Planomicrobium stackebrandtii]